MSYMFLESARSKFPDFDEKCDRVWEKYKFMMEQRNVTRMGFVKLGFYNRYVPPRLDADEPMNDAEHVFECVNLLFLVRSFFSEEIRQALGYTPNWVYCYEQLLIHELGEVLIGDLTDDGTCDAGKKDADEREVLRQFLDDFPNEPKKMLGASFDEFQKNRGIGRCIDKAVFVLDHGAFRANGIDGEMTKKEGTFGLSEQDIFYRRAVGTDRSVDSIYAHFLDQTKHLPLRFIFVGIIEAMYRAEYGECGQRGKVPDTLYAFY